MRLKVLTTNLMIAGVLLLLGWPIFVGSPPKKDSPKKLYANYGVKALVYFGVTSGVWLGTAMSAFLLLKQTQREFLNKEREMLQGLVEGTLKDHGKDA